MSFNFLSYKHSAVFNPMDGVFFGVGLFTAMMDVVSSVVVGDFDHAQKRMDQVNEAVSSTLYELAVYSSQQHSQDRKSLREHVPESHVLDGALAAARVALTGPSLHAVTEALDLVDSVGANPAFQLVHMGALAFHLLNSSGEIIIAFSLMSMASSMIQLGLRQLPLSEERVQYYGNFASKSAVLGLEYSLREESKTPSKPSYHRANHIQAGSPPQGVSGHFNVTDFSSMAARVRQALKDPAMKSLKSEVKVTGLFVDSEGMFNTPGMKITGIPDLMRDSTCFDTQDNRNRLRFAALKLLKFWIGQWQHDAKPIIVPTSHFHSHETLVILAMNIGCTEFGLPAATETTLGLRNVKLNSYFAWPKGGVFPGQHSCLWYEDSVRSVCGSVMHRLADLHGMSGFPLSMMPANLAIMLDSPLFSEVFYTLPQHENFGEFKSMYDAVLQADKTLGEKPPSIPSKEASAMKLLLWALFDGLKARVDDQETLRYMNGFRAVVASGAKALESFFYGEFFPNFRGNLQTSDWVRWAKEMGSRVPGLVIAMGDAHLDPYIQGMRSSTSKDEL